MGILALASMVIRRAVNKGMKQTYVTMSPMAQSVNAVMLYAAVFLLATAVLTLSLLGYKLHRQIRTLQAASKEPVPSGEPEIEDVDIPPESAPEEQPFPEEAYPPPKNPLIHRLTYEPKGPLAKEQRIKAGQDRQNIRFALSSLAHKGAYVFEDIVTEAGAADFLVITRAGIYKIYTMMHEGVVWRDRSQDIIIHSDRPARTDPVTAEEILSGDPLPENPDVYKNEIGIAFALDVGLKPGENYYSIYCFTRARILRQGLEQSPRNMCPLLDLTRWLNIHSEQQNPLPEGRVHELAEVTEEVYSRSPIVRPLEVESDC